MSKQAHNVEKVQRRKQSHALDQESETSQIQKEADKQMNKFFRNRKCRRQANVSFSIFAQVKNSFCVSCFFSRKLFRKLHHVDTQRDKTD